MRMWAFWRRVWYGAGFLGVLLLIIGGLYYTYGYRPAHCLDGFMNGLERGIDCGGGCARICLADTLPPTVKWARSFRVSEGLYNAVAYVENKNRDAGIAHLGYTIKLYDKNGLITSKTAVTELPPGTLYPIFEGRIATGDRIPTQTVIEFDPTPVWVKATQKDERFKVEGRTLSGADLKPVLTASVQNETLDEAQDVEVVATIFDAAGTALTTSRTKIPLFPPRSSKDIIFTWQEPIAKTLRSCEVPTDVILAIDLSGSMNDDGGTPPQPVTAVLEAARNFVLGLNPEDQVGVVTYATNAELVTPLTKDHTKVSALINGLAIEGKEERGSTNTGDAFIRAKDELASPRHNADARNVLILLTDGLATAPQPNPEIYAQSAASGTKDARIEVFTIGLGEKLNESFLQALATDGPHYFRAPTRDTLGNIYSSITGAICEEGAAVIDIIPKPRGIYQPVVE
jgi:Mg-chelatase subunit ChlD